MERERGGERGNIRTHTHVRGCVVLTNNDMAVWMKMIMSVIMHAVCMIWGGYD